MPKTASTDPKSPKNFRGRAFLRELTFPVRTRCQCIRTPCFVWAPGRHLAADGHMLFYSGALPRRPTTAQWQYTHHVRRHRPCRGSHPRGRRRAGSNCTALFSFCGYANFRSSLSTWQSSGTTDAHHERPTERSVRMRTRSHSATSRTSVPRSSNVHIEPVDAPNLRILGSIRGS